MENTRDTRDFDLRQLQLAGKMMACVGTEMDHTEVFGEHVAAELNRDTGMVFLIDAQFRVAMFDGSVLKDWYRCKCGHEGFQRSMMGKECCKQHVQTEILNRSREESLSKSRHAG